MYEHMRTNLGCEHMMVYFAYFDISHMLSAHSCTELFNTGLYLKVNINNERVAMCVAINVTKRLQNVFMNANSK